MDLGKVHASTFHPVLNGLAIKSEFFDPGMTSAPTSDTKYTVLCDMIWPAHYHYNATLPLVMKEIQYNKSTKSWGREMILKIIAANVLHFDHVTRWRAVLKKRSRFLLWASMARVRIPGATYLLLSLFFWRRLRG